MASYPTTYKQLIGSTEELTQPSQTFIAGDGGGRVYVPAQKKRFIVLHKLTQANFAALEAFYVTNALLPVDFVWRRDGATYSCYFEERPVPTVSEPPYRGVTVRLVQV